MWQTFKKQASVESAPKILQKRIPHQKQSDEIYFKALALDLILIIYKTKKTKFYGNELAKKLGISPKTVDEFTRWLKNSKYHELIRFVSKCAQEQS